MNQFKRLTREEMKNLTGGVAQQLYSGGYCLTATGQKAPGSWYYPTGPVGLSQCLADIKASCSSGDGGCTYAQGT